MWFGGVFVFVARYGNPVKCPVLLFVGHGILS